MGRSPWIFLMAIGDVVLTIGVYVLAFWVRFGGFPEHNWVAFIRLLPVLVLATLLMMVIYNQYRDLHRPLLEVAGGAMLSALAATLVTAASAYLDVEARAFPRSIWVIGGLLQSLVLPLWRSWFVRDAKRRHFRRPAVYITERSSEAVLLPDYIRVVECLTPDAFMKSSRDFSDHLIIVDEDVPASQRQGLLEWAARNGVEIYLFPSLHEVLMIGGSMSKLGDRPGLAIRPLSVPPEYRWLKRVIDVVTSLFLVIFFAPVWVLVPIAIILDSRGSVLYRQERVGENGRRFNLIKFRTMVQDAERSTGPVWASTNDPRVTRVGRFLRATRLDELPQLLNVLKGDMSIVGPRPERPVFVKQFAQENPNFRLRELVKPGLTGLAQVMGRYDTSPHDKLRYDLWYIARYSPWLDLRILLWTVQVVLFPQSWTDKPPTWLRNLDWEIGVHEQAAG